MNEPEAHRQFKDQTRQGWDRAAAGWDRQTPHIHRWLRDITETMLDRAGVTAGSRVLDVAAGAGDQTLTLACRVGPTGHVLATDLSPEILRLAEGRAREAQLPQVDFQVADAEQLNLPEGSFDGAVCRLGLMFCPQPLRALQEMQNAVKTGGRVAVIVYSDARANPCKTIPMATARRHAGLPPSDPHQPSGLTALGDLDRLRGLFEQAGFQQVQVQKVSVPLQYETTRDYLHFVQTAMSPVVQLVQGLDPQVQQNVWQDMEEQLEVFQTPEGWVGPAEMLVASGQK